MPCSKKTTDQFQSADIYYCRLLQDGFEIRLPFPVPVEIFPDALVHVDQALRSLSPVEIKLRMAQGKDGPVITENGNLILDVRFDNIPDNLENAIKSITGVIESGLFMHHEVEILNSNNL